LHCSTDKKATIMKLVLTSFLPAFLWVAVTLATESESPNVVRIHHRVAHPNLPVVPFVERGTIVLPDSSNTRAGSAPSSKVSLVPSESIQDDLASFAEEIPPSLAGGMYQIALEHPGDEDESQWAVSVVKTCLLPESTSDTLVLHFSASGKPFTLDYFVSPVPHDGACPQSKSNDSTSVYPALKDTSVILRPASLPPLPELRTPPPLTPQGEPVQPVAEKSFIQKYWIYIVILLGAVLMSGPQEEPQKGGGGAKTD